MAAGRLHPDVGRQHEAEDRDQVLHHVGQPQVDRMEHLLATEREELGGDPAGSDRRLEDLFHLAPALGGEVGSPRQEVAEAKNDRHHVVDFVSHAPGQTPHRLHTLGPLEPLLRALERTEILHRDHVR